MSQMQAKRSTIFGLVLMVIILAGASVMLHRRVGGTLPGREDVYLSWLDGVRLSQGENPYSRIHTGDMRKNNSYPTYLPSFYVASAVLYRVGIKDFPRFLTLWRPVCELSHFLLAGWLLIAGWKRAGLAFAALASCFFFFNRWTLAVVNIAHLDMLALLIWVVSLELSNSTHRRERAASCLLFGMSLAVKQIALFAIPLYVIWEWKAGSRETAVRRVAGSFALIMAVPLLFSLPFLIWDPTGYLKSILFSGTRLALGDFGIKSLDAALGLSELTARLPIPEGYALRMVYLPLGLSGLTARLPMLGLLALLYLSILRTNVGHFISALMVITIWLDFSSVLFYQYMLWAVPLLPLAFLETRKGPTPGAWGEFPPNDLLQRTGPPLDDRSEVLLQSASEIANARLLISLATFNEAENLRPLVAAILTQATGATILVIDDNSPDGTGRIADELKAENPNVVEVLHRPGKLGLGTAVVAGMRYAIEHDYDYFLNMDADFSHPPRFLPDLLRGMADHDVMIGSRYVPGGGVEGEFNLKRKFMSTGINWYARLLLGLTSKDNSGSFRCYRVSKLAEIDLDHIRSRGYSFMEEILFWCRQVGCRIGETPILFENRRAGTSKINKGEAVTALRIILQLGIERLRGRTVRYVRQPTLAGSMQTPGDRA